MGKAKVFQLNACSYEDIPSNTPVINKANFDYFLWIHIPEEIARCYAFYQLDEMAPEHKKVPHIGFIERDCNRPWLKITSSVLGSTVGKHLYKLCFVNQITNDLISLFFSYTIQDDNPDKPYVYMNKEDDSV